MSINDQDHFGNRPLHQLSKSLRSFPINNDHYQENQDHITETYSKYFFEIFVKELYEHSFKSQNPLSIALFKVDNFNLLVRKHGRPTANAILKSTAQLLSNSIPSEALLARYGDSVFSIALPETDRTQANALCQRLISGNHILRPNENKNASFNLTFSIALLTHDRAGFFSSWEQLLEAVNSTLYTAKLLGGRHLLQCKPKMHKTSSLLG